MRTITENLHNRLLAQIEEVKTRGFTKLAQQLENETVSSSIRKDTDTYVYASSDFEADIESLLWKAVIRTADFHNTNFDVKDIEPIVKKISNELVSELRVISNNSSGVGAFEPTVPGELRSVETLRISEDD